MDTKARRSYMLTVIKRYFKAARKEKSSILSEICANLGIHRKSAIRRIHNPPTRRRKVSIFLPNNLIYPRRVIWILEELWKLIDYPCGVILKAAVPLWLPFLKTRYPIDKNTEELLFKISPRQIDRRLREKKRRLKNKIYGKTKPGLLIRSQVPIRTSSSEISEPGSLELDLVSHSGPSSASGDFAYTLNTVDIASTWVERRAVLGKGERGVQKAVDSIRQTMPFALHDIDFDNGSEFLNWHLLGYCNRNHIGYTRSRPYKKDDQAHIEQKNSTHVRRIFGYIRFDKPSVVRLMNDLYENELRLFQNFFKPSQKLLWKKFVGSRMIRRFGKPQTPYQRLLATNALSPEEKEQLEKRFRALDPIQLKASIRQKIQAIYREQRNP